MKASNMRYHRVTAKETRKTRRCKKQEDMAVKIVSSKEVLNNMVLLSRILEEADRKNRKEERRKEKAA